MSLIKIQVPLNCFGFTFHLMVFIPIGFSRNFSHFFLHMLLKTSAYLHSILKAVWHYFGYNVGILILSDEF